MAKGNISLSFSLTIPTVSTPDTNKDRDTRYFFGKSALNNIHKVQEHKRHTTSNILISFISEIINLEILKIALMIYTLSSRIKIHQ